MVLSLTQQHISELSAHAERVYPEECCGLMLGELDSVSARKQLVELIPVENKWAAEAFDESAVSSSGASEEFTKERRYTIDPRDMLRVQKQAREQGLKIIGVYHSHPDQGAVPSECDRAQAWPQYAYTILCVQKGKTADIRNWALDSNHQFQPEAMQVIPSSATDRMPLLA
ncbi:MAG: M67 family metallopeptidase [Phormidesmis sp.]